MVLFSDNHSRMHTFTVKAAMFSSESVVNHCSINDLSQCSATNKRKKKKRNLFTEAYQTQTKLTREKSSDGQ